MTLITAAGCSTGKVSEKGCASSADCTGALKACSDGVCVECVASSDCQSGSYCENLVCKVASCTQNSDCADIGAAQYCDTENGRCVQCLLRMNCGAGEACDNGRCIANPCDHCREGEVCYNGEQCIGAPTDCMGDPGVCTADETCVSVSETQARCFLTCDPSRNLVDQTLNPACWAAYGNCTAIEGNDVCLPPALQSNDLDQDCLNLADIGGPTYQDCMPESAAYPGVKLRCAALGDSGKVCARACDALKQPSAASPECNGKACVNLNDPADEHAGACDSRSRTRRLLETCEGNDPNSSDYNHCQSSTGLKCRVVNDVVKVCVKECGTEVNATCPTGFTCSDAAQGICLPDRGQTQNTGDQCLGNDPTKPAWNNCVNRLVPCLDGVCGPVRTETRNLNEVCETPDPAEATYNACVTGDACYFRCLKTCTLGATPTGCGADETCYDPQNGTTTGWCLKKCDPANGFSTNTACLSGFTCYPSSMTVYGSAGLCLPLPNGAKGTAQIGDACDNAHGVFCDATAGLICSETRAGDKCFKACDPRVTGANPDCSGGQECAEDRFSFKGGRCVAAAAKAEGQTCDDEANRCISGLFCSPDNTCAKDCHIYNQTPATNVDCDAGQYCMTEPWVHFGGYCKPLPAPEGGSRVLDDRCNKGQCNGASGLVCENGYCVKACDPRAGTATNPLCAQTQECAEDVSASFKGGSCLATPTQDVNQTCDNRNQRCLPGLGCVQFTENLKLCKQACDPTIHVNACAADTECIAVATGGIAGACVEQHLQSRLEGETCNVLSDPRQPDWNDCSADLFCDDGATQKCYSGGRRYSVCGQDAPCASIFTCIGVTTPYCFDQCVPDDTNPASTCGNGWFCAPVQGGGGVCIQLCAAKSECTLYGESCSDPVGFGFKYCI